MVAWCLMYWSLNLKPNHTIELFSCTNEYKTYVHKTRTFSIHLSDLLTQLFEKSILNVDIYDNVIPL